MSAADDSRIERLATYGLTPDDIGDEDLVVEEGEQRSTAELPSITVEPESFAEVRKMIGVRPEDSLPIESDHIPAFTPSTEELIDAMESETQPPGSPDESLNHCIDCLLYRAGNIGLSEDEDDDDDGGESVLSEDFERYVEREWRRSRGERAILENWSGRIEDLIHERVLVPELDLSGWRDITIKDGGQLNVDDNTNVLLADEITIHGSGELTYAGNVKIDCDRTIGRP
ncbi:hypothetical protein [Halorubrum sp. Hd13]|uniref:hypothetical protein n=1 Tax=Halorubrum sp. Hd13 TaxID=1480728 RepID=UPI000B994B98|nr:hypothetical protein [Halorubrum sp. Hd13]OYR40850.1 hypothetical protein DJ81_13300 [Halorubrum sp. Hd13]